MLTKMIVYIYYDHTKNEGKYHERIRENYALLKGTFPQMTVDFSFKTIEVTRKRGTPFSSTETKELLTIYPIPSKIILQE